MRITRTIKLIKRSKVLNNQEKRELITKGIIEEVVNSYKFIVRLPLFIIGVTFCLIEGLLEKIFEGVSFISEVLHDFYLWLGDKMPELSLTKGQSRDKLIAEIKGNKFQVK